MEHDVLSEELLKRLLKIVIAYQIVALVVLATWVYVTWNKSDWMLIGVPQLVLEWALLGSVAGALFRLASYPKLSAEEKAQLYIWVLTKPFVGTTLGGVIYFLAAGGVLVLNGNPKIEHDHLLAAVAFLAAFSDRVAFGILARLSLSPKSPK
ncbi:MAG: hypothetical protein HYV04_08190 [Deltaproteobacteria bacterium]|nr:hypothetical protein [Deltaproteobacteria bacterium]